MKLLKTLMITALVLCPVIANCQENAQDSTTVGQETKAEKKVELVKARYVPVSNVDRKKTLRFFTVIGEVRCTSTASDSESGLDTFLWGCEQKSRSGSTTEFVDERNPERQNSEFNKWIGQADAIYYSPADISKKEATGVLTGIWNFGSPQKNRVVVLELPGLAIKYQDPTSADFDKYLNNSKMAWKDALLRLSLISAVKDKKLKEHYPKLRAFLPDQGANLQNWIRSFENNIAAEILIEAKDSSVSALVPALEKLLRYSSDRPARLKSAMLLIKSGNSSIVDAVAKDDVSIRAELHRLLLGN